MKDGAILANAGHFDVEIDKPALAELTESAREVRPLVAEHVLADGRRLHLLAEGRVVNLASAEGHPAAVMDVGFATQALAVERIVKGDLEPGVHRVPDEIDREVARLELDALGVRIDRLTESQVEYLHTWGPAGR
jgi:adenosylhomocysteinase